MKGTDLHLSIHLLVDLTVLNANTFSMEHYSIKTCRINPPSVFPLYNSSPCLRLNLRPDANLQTNNALESCDYEDNAQNDAASA